MFKRAEFCFQTKESPPSHFAKQRQKKLKLVFIASYHNWALVQMNFYQPSNAYCAVNWSRALCHRLWKPGFSPIEHLASGKNPPGLPSGTPGGVLVSSGFFKVEPFNRQAFQPIHPSYDDIHFGFVRFKFRVEPFKRQALQTMHPSYNDIRVLTLGINKNNYPLPPPQKKIEQHREQWK